MLKAETQYNFLHFKTDVPVTGAHVSKLVVLAHAATRTFHRIFLCVELQLAPVSYTHLDVYKRQGSAYPLLLAAENVNTAAGWKPPLSTGPGVGADYRSVALALYQTACVEETVPGCVERAHDLSAMALATPMAVQWGVTNPVVADAPAALDCVRDASAGSWERLRTSFSLLVDSLFSGMDAQREDRNRARCPYTVSYTHLDVYKRQALALPTTCGFV